MTGSSTDTRLGVVTRRRGYLMFRGIFLKRPPRWVHCVSYAITLNGSEQIVIDEDVDAVASLIREGDQVVVHLDDSLTPPTVRPATHWAQVVDTRADTISGVKGLRRSEFRDAHGFYRKTFLVRIDGELEPAVVVEPVEEVAGYPAEQILPLSVPGQTGVIVSAYDYVSYRRRSLGSSSIVDRTDRRVGYAIRLDGDFEPRFILVDQEFDLGSASMKVGDRVSVRVPMDPSEPPTIHPCSSWATILRNKLSRKIR